MTSSSGMIVFAQCTAPRPIPSIDSASVKPSTKCSAFVGPTKGIVMTEFLSIVKYATTNSSVARIDMLNSVAT